MKKKLLLVVTTCMLALGLSACGTDPVVDAYHDQMQTQCESMIQNLEEMKTEDLEAYIEQVNQSDSVSETDVILGSLADGWISIRPDLGDFKEFGEFTLTKSGKTVTATQIVDYTERPLVLTYVYNYNAGTEKLTLNDINVDLVYTTGEKMSKAGLNTIMCITIVFIVLVLISLIIYAFNIIPVLQKKFAAKNNESEAAGSAVVEQIAKKEEQQDDLELIAVISAAIAAATGTSTDDFVVRSIRRR